MSNDVPSKLNEWVQALERRHLRELRVQEVVRALRALSSAYVERRERGAGQQVRGALETAGKRAAFALYYAPLHFIAVFEVVRALGIELAARTSVLDLGCGTGAAGAAWAMAAGSTATVTGIDRHRWAISEARWTYLHLGLRGRTRLGELARFRPGRPGTSVVAAYVLNELPAHARRRTEDAFVEMSRRGDRVLVVEPLARGVAPWWSETARRLTTLGARVDEWHVSIEPPPIIRQLGAASGLNYRELRLRSMWL